MSESLHIKAKLYLTALPNVVYYPITILWSIFYGSIAGVFFKLVSVYENWRAINHLQLLLWKKYPQRSYHKYISNIWANQVRGKSVELAEYTKTQIEKTYPNEPFPIVRLLTNTLFMLFIAPFMAISGLYNGPIYVYKHAMLQRQLLNRNLDND